MYYLRIQVIFLLLMVLISHLSLSFINNVYILQHPLGQKVVLFGDVHMQGFNTQNQIKAVRNQIHILKKQKKQVHMYFESAEVTSNKSADEFLVRCLDQFLLKLELLNNDEQIGIRNIDIRNPMFKAFEKLVKHDEKPIAKKAKKLEEHYARLLKLQKNNGSEHLKRLKVQLEESKKKYFISRRPLMKHLQEEVTTIVRFVKTSLKRQSTRLPLVAKNSALLAKLLFDCEKRCHKWFQAFETNYIGLVAETSLIDATLRLLDIHFILTCLAHAPQKCVLFAGGEHVRNISQILEKMGYTLSYKAGYPIDNLLKGLKRHEPKLDPKKPDLSKRDLPTMLALLSEVQEYLKKKLKTKLLTVNNFNHIVS